MMIKKANSICMSFHVCILHLLDFANIVHKKGLLSLFLTAEFLLLWQILYNNASDIWSFWYKLYYVSSFLKKVRYQNRKS
jgi:predicted membrane protein